LLYLFFSLARKWKKYRNVNINAVINCNIFAKADAQVQMQEINQGTACAEL
jgi:hypothetical protein